jgi:hypothetical protein
MLLVVTQPKNGSAYSVSSENWHEHLKITLVIRFLVLVFSLEVWSYTDSFSEF